MKLVIAAATQMEIQPTIDYLDQQHYAIKGNDFHVLITGIGSLISAYHLTGFLADQNPGYCIQAGIAGTFTNEFFPGSLVLVKSENIGDLGAWEAGQFYDAFDLGLLNNHAIPFTQKQLINPYVENWRHVDIPFVNGITVNEISTQPSRIHMLKDKYGGQIETMEGAAFHYVCLQKKIPFLQLRAISNFIGERDKNKWKFKQALDNLNTKLIDIITTNFF